MKDLFFENILELVRRTSISLPKDVREVIELNRALEQHGSNADLALELVHKNILMAKEKSAPICQDTGTVTFYISTPVSSNQIEIEKAVISAVSKATELGYLRQNSVDSLTGKNSGDNIGPGSPVFHWHQHEKPFVEIKLILKGGGCENMSAQYSLPATINGVRCDRDLAGVKVAILDAVWQAQGKGCGPGFLGVCIGGDRASGFEFAKYQLLRTVDDVNPDHHLSHLENVVLDEANKLGIGPMGFGGKLTLGACKIGALNRLPASFFVSIAYMCWAYRRRGVILDTSGKVQSWLYQEQNENFEMLKPGETSTAVDLEILGKSSSKPTTRVVRLNSPISESEARGLNAGDIVLLSGKVFTGRDEVHKFLFKGGELPVLNNGVIYHCGPVILKNKNEYKVIAAGPTTSIREEPYQAEVIKKYAIKAVIGKGGMGLKTLQACKEYGCVYLHAIGGAAQIYASCVEKVTDVYLLEKFGSPEAVWEMNVKDFPVVVTMDSHGVSLHQEISDSSKSNLQKILV